MPDTEDSERGPCPVCSHSEGAHRWSVPDGSWRLLGCVAPVGSWARREDKACFAGVFRGGGAGPRPRLQRQAEPRVCGAEGPACGKGSPRKGLGVSSTWSQAQADGDASADLGQCGPRGPGWRKQGPHRAGGRTGSVS